MFFFKKKKTLKQQYDESLQQLMDELRTDWEQAQHVERVAREDFGQASVYRQMAESKYFFLFKEARHRQIQAKRRTD